MRCTLSGSSPVSSGVVATRHGDAVLAVMDRIPVSSTEELLPWRTPDGMLHLIEPGVVALGRSAL